MGYNMGPELPLDPGEDHLNIPVHQQQHVAPSDDSDNEAVDAYDGYQPLAMDENEQQNHAAANPDNMEALINNDDDNEVDLMQETVTHGDSNIPRIESIDAEVEREVWSEPRPSELQIELDNTRTEQILTAMAGFTLPNVAVPEWAAGVPEESWKNELLQRIRQRKDGKIPGSGTSVNITTTTTATDINSREYSN